jgi:AcrR family transcriptional regulator
MPGNGNGVNISAEFSSPVMHNGGVSTVKHRYHHGDLANALATAALEKARVGGPDAVVLRDAARTVGVSATAAYRHFAGHNDLLDAVRDQCQQELSRRMTAWLSAGTPEADPGREAIRQLRALGNGYIQFALDEPGLFRTAFCRGFDQEPKPWDALLSAPSFQQLANILDNLVSAGALDPASRPGAEMIAWSSVHGLAMLLLDGPIGTLAAEQQRAIIDRVVEATITGVLGRPA